MKEYKVTVEELTGEKTLCFEAESREDIFVIVEKLKQHPELGNDAAAFGLGLKLFTSVMMKQKSNPLFENLLPAFKDFMMELKGSGKRK